VDERGWLMATDRAFEGMEVAYSYATCCFPGVVKGWHRHTAHEDRMYCVSGLARVVTCQIESWAEGELQEAIKRRKQEGQRPLFPEDWPRVGRDFREFITGPLSPRLVVVPPGWWHGFQALNNEPCVIVNCPDQPYDPGDEEKMELGAIPFEWRRVDG
jgi:dTDP-4-dehydrorhamnose 3,5-epimerase